MNDFLICQECGTMVRLSASNCSECGADAENLKPISKEKTPPHEVRTPETPQTIEEDYFPTIKPKKSIFNVSDEERSLRLGIVAVLIATPFGKIPLFGILIIMGIRRNTYTMYPYTLPFTILLILSAFTFCVLAAIREGPSKKGFAGAILGFIAIIVEYFSYEIFN